MTNRRIGLLRITDLIEAGVLAVVFGALPEDTRIVRIDSSLLKMEHCFFLESEEFDPMTDDGIPTEITAEITTYPGMHLDTKVNLKWDRAEKPEGAGEDD